MAAAQLAPRTPGEADVTKRKLHRVAATAQLASPTHPRYLLRSKQRQLNVMKARAYVAHITFNVTYNVDDVHLSFWDFFEPHFFKIIN